MFFWHSASCGPSEAFANLLKSELSNNDLSAFSKGQFETGSGANASTLTNLTDAQEMYLDQIIGGDLPAPCNESYVSYACANSSDGIVYEDRKYWLGALLPADFNGTEVPPIPSDFLTLNGLSSSLNDNSSTSLISDGGCTASTYLNVTAPANDTADAVSAGSTDTGRGYFL